MQIDLSDVIFFRKVLKKFIQLFILLGKYHIHVTKRAKHNCEHYIK